MRIAVNALSVAPGGGLTNILGLLEGWSGGNGVSDLLILASNPQVLDAAVASGANVIRVEKGGLTRRALWESIVMPAHLRRFGAQLVLCSNFAMTGCRYPQVVQHQTLTTFSPLNAARFGESTRRMAQRRAAARSVQRAAANVFISSYLHQVAEKTSSAPPTRSYVVPYGISRRLITCANASHANGKSSLTIAALQSPIEYKDNESLLQALRILVERHPDEPWRLRLAGAYDWSRWKKRAQALGVFDRISWEGYISEEEVIKLLSSCDCLVYPSVFEAFGLPLIESMACGCPVIAADAAASPEVTAGAAIIVPPHSPEAIAEAILKLRMDRSVRDRLVELGRRRALQFDWTKTVKALNEIFRGVLMGGSHPA